MGEILGGTIGVLALVVLFLYLSDGLGGILGEILVPVVRWVQKVFFGIVRPVAGSESLIGRQVQVAADFSVAEKSGRPEGYVVIDGERWRARTSGGSACFSAGETLNVVGRDGLVLLVGGAKSDARRTSA